MRRFLSLFALMLLGLVPMMAQDASGTLVKGDRISWSAVKAGDEILLQNASGTWNFQYSSVVTDLTICFLQGVADNYNRNADTHQLDCSMAALSSDNIYIVVEAPEQHEGVPSYYLQHKDTKKYVQGVESGLQTFLVDNIAEATSFEVEGALDSYEPHDQWQSTGLVDNETAVLTHYNGDTKLHFGPFWNYGYTYYGPATDIIVWNIYHTAYDQSAKAKLGALIDKIKADKPTFPIGTDPGYYPEELVTTYETAFLDADEYYADGADIEEEYAKYYDRLTTAYDNVKNGYIKITDGYYRFVSAYSNWMTLQGTEKSLKADTEHHLAWGNYDTKDPTQLFKVTVLAEGEYSIQNVATGEYINTVEGKEAIVPMSAEQITPQTFSYFEGTARWSIANKANPVAYRTNDHDYGYGLEGTIYTVDGGSTTASAWYVRPETNQELIDSLTKAGPQRILNDKMNVTLASAQTAKDKAFDYPELITDGKQISSNALQSGSYANLIDGDVNTVFHSIWDATLMKSELGEGVGYHNLQVAFNEPVDKLFFRYTGVTGTNFHDSPNNIGIYVTNDDELGASTAAADSTKWVHVTDLTEGFPDDVRAAKYTSPLLTFDQAYKYVRLVVRHTTHQGKHSERTFMNPFSTGVTFNLSELQLYKPDYAETSLYSNVSGMKEAADNMLQLMTAGEEKVKNNTVTDADIEALNAAIKAVNALYINRDSLYTELANTVTEAQKAYNDALGSKQALITDASQFSSNQGPGSSADFSSFEHLLTPETHYNYNYHSFFIADAMSNPNITPDEWMQALAARGAKYVGYGYHNLQVRLNEPIKNFWLEYTSRTDTKVIDSPTDIEVYATNDDALGADPDQANVEQWTKVTELTEGFPGTEPGGKYTSPVIDLGGEYKYVRFVIKNTAMNGNGRAYANPDVTGMTWNVACWQMYNGLDPQRVQYNYNEDMHKAVDAMKALIDDAEATSKKTVLNNDKQTALRSAIDLVLSLYADSTELSKLYKKYNTLINTAVIGTGVGYVDTQEAVDAFAAVIKEAKTTVDPIQPTKASIDAAVAKITEAYSIFDSHVGKVEAGKWYHILSAAAEGDRAVETVLPAREVRGAALYVTSSGDGFGSVEGDYKYENQLRWGMDDVKFKDMAVDPDAMWQFIAAPEQGENVYYIQNMRKGSYIGNSNGSTNPYDPYYYDTAEPMPFRLDLIGAGQFNIVAIGDTNNPGAISAGDNARQIRGDMVGTIGLNQRTSWTIEPIDPSIDAITLTYPSNSVQVVTLPYSVSNIGTINDGVQTYTIHSQVSATELALVKKDEFAAGEPFIMTIGDLTQYEDDHSNMEISIVLPTSATAKADTVNGLVGVLSQRSVKGNGYGFIENAVLKVLAEDKSASIGSQSGYIVPSLIKAQEGEYNLILTTEGALGIKQVAGSNDALVNVYTVDGKLIKRNIKKADALKSLKKGIYIVGKKKVAVK